jgi:nitric oxide reductase activation protein
MSASSLIYPVVDTFCRSQWLFSGSFFAPGTLFAATEKRERMEDREKGRKREEGRERGRKKETRCVVRTLFEHCLNNFKIVLNIDF